MFAPFRMSVQATADLDSRCQKVKDDQRQRVGLETFVGASSKLPCSPDVMRLPRSRSSSPD